ncbi:MAG: hypothetical protein OZ921_01025 [Sorangiineae bacterium]|nr:hypothetical protein [Polyangiaceae bacterium]MEB2321066.1 hypothetical protein [Sorangiineae bacterium]
MSALAQAAIDAVAGGVLEPLITGGALTLTAPIGDRAALETAGGVIVVASAALPALRLRAARRLAPVDELPEPDEGEWLCAFALNDLLQVTNPSLDGMFVHDRPARLVTMVEAVLARAGAPKTLGQALSRHATFGRLSELVRIDTHVSWWVGERDFQGAEPPGRLLAWPKARRVRRESTQVALSQMAPADAPWAPRWRAAVARLFTATPLSDLASASRAEPRFAWSQAALELISLPAGRALALRAVERGAGGAEAVIGALRSAAEALTVAPAARAAALSFVGELGALVAARREASESERAVAPLAPSLGQ